MVYWILIAIFNQFGTTSCSNTTCIRPSSGLLRRQILPVLISINSRALLFVGGWTRTSNAWISTSLRQTWGNRNRLNWPKMKCSRDRLHCQFNRNRRLLWRLPYIFEYKSSFFAEETIRISAYRLIFESFIIFMFSASIRASGNRSIFYINKAVRMCD